MRHLSFRQRQFLILLAMAIVILGISAASGLSSSQDAIIQRTTAQLETVADLKTIQVQHWLDEGREVARLISNLHDLRKELPTLLAPPDAEALALTQADLYAEVGTIINIFPHVQSVSLLHPTSGQVLLSTDPTQEGRERRDEGYFREGQQALYVSPVAYSVGREAPVLTVSAPVRDESGGLLAVVAVEVNLADLDATLSSRAGLGQTGRAYLVEAYGFYVTLPPDLAGGPLRTIAESEGVRRALAGQNGYDTYLDPRGVRVRGVYRWLPEANLGLLVEIEEAELTGQIRRAETLIILTNLGVLALAVVAARYLANWLVAPLERIAGTARALQAGDLSRRAPPSAPDEIGQLAAAFNEMADSLQRSYENLEQLVEQRTAELRIANEQLQRDITERKRAEEALRESEEKLRVLFERTYDLVTLTDANATVLWANPAWENVFEDLTRREDPFKLIHPGDLDEVTQAWNALVTKQEAIRNLVYRFKGDDGEYGFFESSAYSVTIGGEPLFYVVARDITERVQAEKERERLLAELEAKNKELESFVYTVSHDLKAPLVSLGGFSSALQNEFYDQLGEEGKHYLERIQANVGHMDALIMDLLELSRIGRVVGAIEEIDVAALLREIQEELAVELEEAGAEFVVQEPLPAFRADRSRIRQVFANLIDNAVKFRSEERPLRIEVGCQEERGFYRSHVADNGIGIARQYQEQIFAPFQQLDAGAEGVGMGLALVKKIVKHHGGRVWVESEAGEGATFYFTVPVITEKEGDNYERSNGRWGD